MSKWQKIILSVLVVLFALVVIVSVYEGVTGGYYYFLDPFINFLFLYAPVVLIGGLLFILLDRRLKKWIKVFFTIVISYLFICNIAFFFGLTPAFYTLIQPLSDCVGIVTGTENNLRCTGFVGYIYVLN